MLKKTLRKYLESHRVGENIGKSYKEPAPRIHKEFLVLNKMKHIKEI